MATIVAPADAPTIAAAVAAPLMDVTTTADVSASDADAVPALDVMPASEPSAPAPVTALTPEIRWHCGPTGLNEAVLSIDFLHQRTSATAVPPPQPQSPPSSQSSATCDAGSPIPSSHSATPNDNDNASSPLPTILATGGADKEIKLWRVDSDNLRDHSALTFIFSLSGHDRSVNCVRFSPNGEWLASASDDSTVILWTKPKTAAADWSWDTIASFSDVARTLLACGHKGDITDLAWSPDSAYLCSTSVDNSSVIWSVAKGDVAERRKDHTQYVQGVAWDPLNEFLATAGNDRACRVYALQGFGAGSNGSSSKKAVKKCVCVQTLKTRELPVASPSEQLQSTTERTESAGSADPPPKHRMFLDDTCPAFARRLAWTPDGSYLLAPTGSFKSTATAQPVHTVYAFARGHLSAPTLHLPGHAKPSLGVRCSPLLYELRSESQCNLFQMPRRAVFAVVTLDAVAIYDTQLAHPLCTLKHLHYADLTDASWSRDGRVLAVSSMDGYLSFIQFADGFLGEPVPSSELAALNTQQMQRMFAAPKVARKKLKTLATPAAAAANATPDDAKKKVKAGTLLVARKKTAVDAKATTPADVVVDAKARVAPVAVSPVAGVHTLQVRKKRKIAPVLVHAAAAAAVPPVVAPAAAVLPVVAPVVATSAHASEDAAVESDASVGEPVLL